MYFNITITDTLISFFCLPEPIFLQLHQVRRITKSELLEIVRSGLFTLQMPYLSLKQPCQALKYIIYFIIFFNPRYIWSRGRWILLLLLLTISIAINLSAHFADRMWNDSRQNDYLKIVIIILGVMFHKVFISKLFLPNNITVICRVHNQQLS